MADQRVVRLLTAPAAIELRAGRQHIEHIESMHAGDLIQFGDVHPLVRAAHAVRRRAVNHGGQPFHPEPPRVRAAIPHVDSHLPGDHFARRLSAAAHKFAVRVRVAWLKAAQHAVSDAGPIKGRRRPLGVCGGHAERRAQIRAGACTAGTRLVDVPPSMRPMSAVTRPGTSASPAPASGSEMARARSIASNTAGGASSGKTHRICSPANALSNRSIAWSTRCTWAPCAVRPAASISAHKKPLSPNRRTRGDPASRRIAAFPLACGTWSGSQQVPSGPSFPHRRPA